MKKTELFIFVLLFALTTNVQSQISVTSYSIHALGVNTSKEKKISAELKVFLNREVGSILSELSGMYNFKRKNYHQFSAGFGVNIAPFSGPDHLICFTVPVQLEIFPLQNFKQLSVVFEVTPELYPEDGLSMRQLWGLRYSFNKKLRK